MKKKTRLLTVITLGLAACWLSIAIAGNINYGGDPADGSDMPTLQEVYDYLVSATPETVNSTFQEPAGAPGSTGKTTREIYDVIQAERNTDLVAGNIKDTVEIFGVTGNFSGGSGVPETGQIGQHDTNTPKADDGDATDPPGSALPSPRFTDNGNGSVTDNLTGLIWLKNANCANVKANWQPALNYVVDLNGTGKMNSNDCGDTDNNTDWRLPTVKELQSLIHFGYGNPALTNDAGNAKWNTTGTSSFSNVISDYYWSSTSYSDGTTDAWCVSMHGGNVFGGNRAVNDWYVWPVRGGQ
jgi:hypothetical protein